MKPDTPWLDIHEAAAHLKVHPQTLRKMARRRQVRHARATGLPKSPLRFRIAWLDEAMKETPVEVVGGLRLARTS